MSATVRDVLVAARELIATPERWTQGEEARAVHGSRVSPMSSIAVSWCAVGAIYRVAMGSEFRANGALHALRLATRNRSASVARVNDDPRTTHADVLAAFDRAIAAQDGA